MFRRRGDSRRAGLIATYLAGEHRIDGQHAAAAGWLARARRLLADAGTVPELGWLEIEEAKRAADPVVAEGHARAALEVAQALSDPDVECMALAQLGRAVVRQGRVDDGVNLLDEAMTIALGGETSDPLACGDACCTTLVVCESLADLHRAAEWCAAVVEFTERRRFIPVQSWCRGIYAGVLVRAGDWERADDVLADALGRRPNRSKQGGRALPLAVLAGLRLRQGRMEDAATLLDGLDDEPAALAPLVELSVERGDLAYAQALLDRRPDADDGGLLVLRGALALATGDIESGEIDRRERCTMSPPRQVETTSPPRQPSSTGARPRSTATSPLPRMRWRTPSSASRRCTSRSRRPGAARPRARPGDKRLSTRALDGARCARLLRGARRPNGRRPGRRPAAGARRRGAHRDPRRA